MGTYLTGSACDANISGLKKDEKSFKKIKSLWMINPSRDEEKLFFHYSSKLNGVVEIDYPEDFPVGV